MTAYTQAFFPSEEFRSHFRELPAGERDNIDNLVTVLPERLVVVADSKQELIEVCNHMRHVFERLAASAEAITHVDHVDG